MEGSAGSPLHGYNTKEKPIYSSMPDTTSGFNPYRRSLIRLFGASMMFLAALLLVTSVGTAQDSEDFDCADFSTQAEAQRVYDANNPTEDPFNLDADDDGRPCESLDGEDAGDSEDNGGVEDDDSSVSGNQYEDEDQQPAQTPQTGGPDLLVIAAGLLSVLGVMGIGLSCRRR